MQMISDSHEHCGFFALRTPLLPLTAWLSSSDASSSSNVGESQVLSDCKGRVGSLTPFEDACAFNRRVRELSGIERFHSHLCRHTFATEWREAGGSLAALQAVLGHGTIAVTERYGTIGDDLVEREALRLVQHRAQGGVR